MARNDGSSQVTEFIRIITNAIFCSRLQQKIATKMKALIIVDVQNDFCEGGALEVKGSNSIFPFINQLIKDENFAKIFITKDWHPSNHISFAINHGKKPFEMIEDRNGEKEMLWPVHCVQYSEGAQLSPLLELDGKNVVQIRKGYIPDEECYSGFGTSQNPTKLLHLLQKSEIEEVVIVGLALDYCVGSTSLDAAKAGFKVLVIHEATKAVSEETGRQMIARMKAHGIKLIDFKTFMSENSKTLQSSDDSSNQI